MLAGAALPLLIWALVGARRALLKQFRTHARTYLLLGLLEAANLTLYTLALSIGPTPVVIALHLTAPVILVANAIRCGHQRLDTRTLGELVLILGAILLVSLRYSTSESASHAMIGCVLALGSAAAVAALISIVATASTRRTDPVLSAGLQLGVAAILMSPYFYLALPDRLGDPVPPPADWKLALWSLPGITQPGAPGTTAS